jgi:hypothetical protein
VTSTRGGSVEITRQFVPGHEVRPSSHAPDIVQVVVEVDAVLVVEGDDRGVVDDEGPGRHGVVVLADATGDDRSRGVPPPAGPADADVGPGSTTGSVAPGVEVVGLADLEGPVDRSGALVADPLDERPRVLVGTGQRRPGLRRGPVGGPRRGQRRPGQVAVGHRPAPLVRARALGTDLVEPLVLVGDRQRRAAERAVGFDLGRFERRLLDARPGDDRPDELSAGPAEGVSVLHPGDEPAFEPVEVVVEPPGVAHSDALAKLRERHSVVRVGGVTGLPERQQDGEPRLVAERGERLGRVRRVVAGYRVERRSHRGFLVHTRPWA